MRLLSLILLTGLLGTRVLAQDAADIPKQKHDYQVRELTVWWSECCLTCLVSERCDSSSEHSHQ